VIGAASAWADSGMAAARVPLSARQQATGGTYGTYDVLGVIENPSILVTQPREVAVNAADVYLFGAQENAIGLGVGWMTGSVETGVWGLALVAGQVATAGFNVVDDLGHDTVERIAPVARRIDLAGAYKRFGLAIGAAIGMAAESYGTLADGVGHGPGGAQVSAGIFKPLNGGSVGAALQFPGLGTHLGATVPDVLNAGGSIEALGLTLTSGLVVPLARPAAPSALVGFRWPIADAFDLAAGYKMTVAPGVSLRLGSSIRMGFSLRSRGLGMDYTLVVPLFSGAGLTNLIALGWDIGDRRLPPSVDVRPDPVPVPQPGSRSP